MDDKNLLCVLRWIVFFIALTSAAEYRIHKRNVPQRESDGKDLGQHCIALESPRDNYKELNTFGETFLRLSKGLNAINNNNETGDVILFVGNTGAGKSSLVHILAGDTDTFVGTEVSEDSGDYFIQDTSGKSVTMKTTESTTVYPEAVADRESNAIFFDTPGFRDTRSSIHEIVATLGLHKVATLSRRIKIALLVNYNSLTVSGPRADFLNTLDSFFNLLKNENKYKNSIYLIASKVVNQIIYRNGKFLSVSDETYLTNIAEFLKRVETTLNDPDKQNLKYDQAFVHKTQSLIDRLTTKDENTTYNRIALFKKPTESGPIMNSETIQQSIASIRKKLVDNDDDYVDVEVDDFGFTLSDSAMMYIKDLYELMNSYIVEVSKTFEKALIQFLQLKFNVFNDIVKIRESLAHIGKQIDVLIDTTNASKYPHQYVDAIIQMTRAIGVNICNDATFVEINQLDEYLKSVGNITSNDLYTPKRWVESFRSLERTVKDEDAYYTMLQTVFDKLFDYSNDDFLAKVDKVLNNSVVNQHNYAALMKHLELDQYASLTLNEDKLDEINKIVTMASLREVHTFCSNGTLTIIGDFLRTQQLDERKIASCKGASTIALLATYRLYIDSNLETSGRNLVMIAPEWWVMGKFLISVDGTSGGDNVMKKASTGMAGLNGEPGQSAGQFVGVALRYVNSKQLNISASGGDGQQGQEGGDGQDGEDGRDGAYYVPVNQDRHIYIVFNAFVDTTIIKGDYGTRGGDAGLGGRGGLGGEPGSVVVHTLATTDSPPDGVTILQEMGARGRGGANGKPGRGGLKGCDAIKKEIERSIFFIPISKKITYEPIACNRRNPNGGFKPRSFHSSLDVSPERVPSPPSVCHFFKAMSSFFETTDNIETHALISEFEQAFIHKFACSNY